jgi:hypothetical protein
MSQPRPTWRVMVERLDRTVSPRADAVVRTNLFADSVAAMIRLEAQVRRRAERQTTRVWHLWNLPTAGDIRRMRSQLSSVEARLRDMSERLEESEEARRAAEPHPRPVSATPRNGSRATAKSRNGSRAKRAPRSEAGRP